jgi:hypothetical protein
MSKKSIVICRLPDAGLGNQLFPLVKAAIFARLNGLPLIVNGYNRFKIGPYLRGEKIKRNYRGYFTFQKGFFARQMENLFLLRHADLTKITEPTVEKLPNEQIEGKQFYFSEIPHWKDFFAGIREHRELAIELLWGMIHDRIKTRLAELPPPSIGMHIRMGDFRKLKANEDFKRVGAVRTPEIYFVEMLSAIRKVHGSDLPVLIFTDGYKKEFETIFSFANTSMVEGNADIVDMLLLSRSKIIIASAGSTFSYWSGFLSNAPVILHPDHLHAPLRPEQINELSYEGPFNTENPDPLLIRNIVEAKNSE